MASGELQQEEVSSWVKSQAACDLDQGVAVLSRSLTVKGPI